MERPLEGPGQDFVKPLTMVAIGLYLIVGTIVCIIALSQMWPHPTPSLKPDQTTPNVEPQPASVPAGSTTSPAPATPPAASTPTDGGTTTSPPTGGVDQTTAAPSKTEPIRAAVTTQSTSNTRFRPVTEAFLAARCGDRDFDCKRCEQAAHLMREHLDLRDQENDPECLRILNMDVVMWNERRLMLIVVLAGALGGLLYANRSFFWYVGNRSLVQSWIPIYLFAPFTSALIGLVIYLIIRGGFFSGVSTIGDTSPYAFAAVAVLAGMHHRETAEKLRQIFEVVFTKAQAGKDTAHPKPRIIDIKADQDPPLSRTKASQLTIIGDGFVDESSIRLDGKAFRGKLVRVSSTQLNATVRPEDLEDLDDEIYVTVYNPAPGGGSSDGVKLKVESKTQ